MNWLSLIGGLAGAAGDGGGGADWSTGQYKGRGGAQTGHGMQMQTAIQGQLPPESMLSMGGQLPPNTLDLSSLISGFRQDQQQPQVSSTQRNPFLNGSFASLFQ